MIEIWKDIEGFEGLYQIGSCGNVKSVRNNIILKLNKNRCGYLLVKLCKNGKKNYFTVHRLVAKAFIPNPDSKPHIDHIDTVKTNNHVDNLRWVTPSENMMNEKTYSKILKEREKQKMPVSCFTMGGEYVKTYESVISVKKDGHCESCVSQCCKGIFNQHHNMIWKYANT